jgi:hypothetical protein
MTDTFMRFAGWTAYANAGLTIANIVTIMIFFSAGGFWGRLNDGVSVLWALSFIPLAIVLYRVNTPVNGPASLLAAVIGIAAMLVFAVLQILLVMKQVTFEQTVATVLTTTGIIGLSLVLNGLLARAGETLPAGLVWLTLAFGLGFVLGGIGFWIGGPQHPLAMVGFLVTALIGPVWAIWLGRLLLNSAFYTLTTLGAGGSA